MENISQNKLKIQRQGYENEKPVDAQHRLYKIEL